MDPFAQFDAALLGFARKIVNVWSRATGKTNFALARLLAKTSFVFLLACILSLSAFWHFGISFMFVWFVVLPFELLSKIIPDFEKEAKRQDERNAAAAAFDKDEYGWSFGFVFFGLVGLGVLGSVATLVGGTGAFLLPFTYFLFWCFVTFSYFIARCFDKGGKSKVVEWVKALATKVRALGPQPKLVPTPVPVRN